jgi:hypothetical protein
LLKREGSKMENEFADLSQLQIDPEDMAVVIKAKQTKRQHRKELGRYAVVPMAWVHRMLGCRSPAAWQLMICHRSLCPHA